MHLSSYWRGAAYIFLTTVLAVVAVGIVAFFVMQATGHIHTHEELVLPSEEPGWPEPLKAQMLASCEPYADADEREACACIFDWYSQNMTIEDFLTWSAILGTGKALRPEIQNLFSKASHHCGTTEYFHQTTP